MIVNVSVENQMSVLFSVIDRRNDQRSRVFIITIITRIKEWVEFLSEVAVSKGADQSCSINVIKGNQTLVIMHKHPHLHRLRLQRETDWRVRKSKVLISIQQTNLPGTILRFTLLVDRLSNHS